MDAEYFASVLITCSITRSDQSEAVVSAKVCYIIWYIHMVWPIRDRGLRAKRKVMMNRLGVQCQCDSVSFTLFCGPCFSGASSRGQVKWSFSTPWTPRVVNKWVFSFILLDWMIECGLKAACWIAVDLLRCQFSKSSILWKGNTLTRYKWIVQIIRVSVVLLFLFGYFVCLFPFVYICEDVHCKWFSACHFCYLLKMVWYWTAFAKEAQLPSTEDSTWCLLIAGHGVYYFLYMLSTEDSKLNNW